MDNIDQYINPTAARDQLGIAPAELQQTLKLAGLLQTSLEIESVLNYFLQAAQQLVKFATQALRSTDMLFRFGGEEFVVVLPGVNVTGAKLAAERLRSIIEKHVFNSRQGTVPVTISVGTASLTMQDTVKTMIDRADNALYSAKNSGRNCVACSEELIESTLHEVTTVHA